MLKKFDLNLVKVLHALFEDKNVTKAGHRLGRTQSAVSNSLKRLREAFSDPLFVRSGEGLEPTTFAETLRQPVYEIMATGTQLVAARAKFDPATARITYRIAAPDRLSLPIIRPLLAYLRGNAPMAGVDLVTSDRENALAHLENGRVDVVIGWFDRPPTGLHSEFLFRSNLVGIARADHPLAHTGSVVDLGELLAYPHLVVSSAGDRRAAFDVILGRKRLEREIRLAVGNFGLVPSVLGDSDMVGVYTREVANELAQAADLSLFEIETEPAKLDHYLVWSRANHSDPAQMWLRDRIRALSISERVS